MTFQQKKWNAEFKESYLAKLRDNNCQLRILPQTKITFKSKGETKISETTKLRECHPAQLIHAKGNTKGCSGQTGKIPDRRSKIQKEMKANKNVNMGINVNRMLTL